MLGTFIQYVIEIWGIETRCFVVFLLHCVTTTDRLFSVVMPLTLQYDMIGLYDDDLTCVLQQRSVAANLW